MYIAADIAFCFVLSIISISVAEILFHKYLFHKNIKIINYIVKLWGHDPIMHVEHHKVSRKQLEDPLDNEDGYWVQKPSNVSVAGAITYAGELIILWVLGLQWPFWILTALLTVILFTVWYILEDHFHIGMHKPHYYEKNIKGKWLEPWFQYCKRLHAIHHQNPRYNYGFVFFPIGDLILGSFCDDLKKKKPIKDDPSET